MSSGEQAEKYLYEEGLWAGTVTALVTALAESPVPQGLVP